MSFKPEPKTWVEISAKNLRHNYFRARKLAGSETAVMAVVKANAYGHGLAEAAGVLASTPGMFFGVDSLEEALLVRKIAPRVPTMILGYIPDGDFDFAARSGFHVSIYRPELVLKAARFWEKNGSRGKFHLKIETGTNRLGIQIGDLLKMKRLPGIEGIYTHFAETENPSSNFYIDQLRVLDEAVKLIMRRQKSVPYIHAGATSGLLQFPKARRSMVRLGIGLYGLWPSEEIKNNLGSSLRFEPVLSWKTRLAQAKVIAKGETVGYDRTYRAPAEIKIGILPVGYYDGYDRRLSNAGEVVIRGKRAPVCGRVCMNMTIVDITGMEAKAGNEVVLIGPEFTAEEMAHKTATINYEIVSRINPLLPRMIV